MGEPFRIGRFFLGKRAGSPAWCACWYEPGSRGRNVRRVSLGTADLESAKVELARFVVERQEARDTIPADATLADCFHRYWVRHGLRLVGADQQRRSLAMILERTPEGLTVERFTLRHQEAVVERMRAEGYDRGTIKRAFGAARAAIGWNFRHEFVARVPAFVRLPDSDPRDVVLTVDELATFWDACEPEHVRAFFLILLGTAARPSAALELHRSQCDLARRLIDLNPPGRLQNRKRRPVVPMTDFLAALVEASPDGPLVAWQGRQVVEIKGTWRKVRAEAGLGPHVVPYAVRHTVATELRARGVPEMELAGVLGHVMPNVRTTGRYAKFRPDYMGQARRALDDFAREIGRAATRPIPWVSTSVRALRVLGPDDPARQSDGTSGAGEGIRTLDPNLGKVVLYP